MKKKLKLGFMECDTCRPKPGSPLLCNGCFHNRTVIARLQEKIEKLKRARKKKERQDNKRSVKSRTINSWIACPLIPPDRVFAVPISIEQLRQFERSGLCPLCGERHDG